MSILINLSLMIVSAILTNFCVNMMTYYWRVKKSLVAHHRTGHATVATLNSVGMFLLALMIGVDFQNYFHASIIFTICNVTLIFITSSWVGDWLYPKQLRWLKEL